MKTYLTILLPLLFCFSAFAQQESPYIEKGKFTLGLNFQTVSYHIYYKDVKAPGSVGTGYFEPISMNVGYQFSDRASIRVGIGYGRDREKLTESIQNIEYKIDSKTHAIASPVSFYFTFFNLLKKLPVYGTLSVMPAYGFTNTEVIENDHGSSHTYTLKDSGLDVFATAGVGFNYRISDSFYGNVSYFFYKTNITGKNSFYHDWDRDYPDGRSFFKSFELGLNYKL